MGVLFALSGQGCAARASSPRATLDALASAAQRGDATALRAMLTARGRQGEDAAAFQRRIAAEGVELRALAAGLRTALSRGEGPVVELPAAGGAALAVEERDGWRVADTALGPGSPTAQSGRAGMRAAVHRLHRALERGDLAGLLSLLSARARGGIEADLAALAEATASPEALDIPDVPAATRVRLPDGRYLVLVREDDAWRVDRIADTP